MNINEIIEKIKADPRFLQLKNVVENNPWHDHQPVFDHIMLVLNAAKENITGDFIENEKAKELFVNFVNETVDGDFRRKDCMLLTALLHDIAKCSFYKDEGKEERPILHERDGKTSCPGHEYVGSILAPQLLKGLVTEKAISYICKIISMHDSINDAYINDMKGWQIEDVVDNIKSRSESFYIESLFNIYCDVFYPDISVYLREITLKIFNSPDFYTKRTYYLK